MNATASTSRWSLDYTTRSTIKGAPSIPNPPGFLPTTITSSKSSLISASSSSTMDLVKLRDQKAWEVAIGPAKNVPMQAFMMYMTGGGVQIFSMMSVWFLLKGAVVGVLSVNSTFAPFESSTPTSTSTPLASSPFLLQKLVFIACQIALLAVGFWKVNSMGLMPELTWLHDLIDW